MLDDSDTARALRRLRELSSLSDRTAARLLGVSRKTLRRWENHEVLPTPQQLARAVAVYCHDVRKLIVPRQTIVSPEDPDTLVVGSQRIDLAAIRRDNPSHHGFNRNVLARYIDAVRSERGENVEVVQLRATDLFELSRALDLSDTELEILLTEAFNLTPAGIRATSRALLAAAILSVSVLGTVAGPWFTPVASADPAPLAAADAAPPIFSTGPNTAGPEPTQWVPRLAHEKANVFSTDPRNTDAPDDPRALPPARDEVAPNDSQGDIPG